MVLMGMNRLLITMFKTTMGNPMVPASMVPLVASLNMEELASLARRW